MKDFKGNGKIKRKIENFRLRKKKEKTLWTKKKERKKTTLMTKKNVRIHDPDHASDKEKRFSFINCHLRVSQK